MSHAVLSVLESESSVTHESDFLHPAHELNFISFACESDFKHSAHQSYFTHTASPDKSGPMYTLIK